MIKEIFTVRDAKAGAFMQPFFTHNKSVAVRSIKDTLRDPDHIFSRHPEDFDLFYCGSYCEEDGKFELIDTPEHVTKLIALIDKE